MAIDGYICLCQFDLKSRVLVCNPNFKLQLVHGYSGILSLGSPKLVAWCVVAFLRSGLSSTQKWHLAIFTYWRSLRPGIVINFCLGAGRSNLFVKERGWNVAENLKFPEIKVPPRIPRPRPGSPLDASFPRFFGPFLTSARFSGRVPQAKQSEAKQSKAEQSKAKESKAKESKAKESKAKVMQSKAKESAAKAKQCNPRRSKAEQSRAKQKQSKAKNQSNARQRKAR